MHKELLFFFYTLCININNIISNNIFVLPFYLYKNTLNDNINIFIVICVFFIILFITCYNIKKNINLDDEKNPSYLYFLSDYFYYITLLCIINSNIFYINNIINLYNNISLFYSSIGIIILLFIFILIHNKTTNINNFLIIIKLMIFVTIIYCLYNISNHIKNITNITHNFNIWEIIESMPILFFSFLGNDYIFHIADEKNNENIKKNQLYINTFSTFSLINLIYIGLYYKTKKIFSNNMFIINKTLSEILLKQNYQNNIIHILNILIIIISFFTIYTIILQCQQIIEKTIKKTQPHHTIPETIILFFIVFSIVIISKIIIIEKKNIIIGVFFSTLSFLCYIINFFKFSILNFKFFMIIISIFFLLLMNIISIYQLILIM